MFPFSLYGLLGAAALSLLIGAGTAGWVVYKVEQGTIANMRAADATALAQAVTSAAAHQHAVDTIATVAASSEAQAQAAITTHTVILTKEITRYVPETRACIPVGLVRLLNAAATGGDPAGVNYAPGQLDDACAAVSWRDFAADLADDYGTGHANAEQLNALEAWQRATNAATTP